MAGVDCVIDACSMRVGEVDNEPLFARLIGLWDETHGAYMT